jgi:UDP-glucose 4-epimerase
MNIKKTKILITGGAGFIGSHVVKELIDNGYTKIIVLDSLITGHKEAILDPAKLIVVDLADDKKLSEIFRKERPEVVIHFAAYKEAGESVLNPEKYYKNNIVNGLNLLSVMKKYGVKNIIFSSSAAVYGNVDVVPITEETPTNPINPYGWTKLMFEKILSDYDNAYGIRSISLRYFNAGGADVDGKLGNNYPKKEDLVSVLVETALGKKEKFVINGIDYNTPDGSCVRDIIHVNDLAVAHVLALEYLINNNKSDIFNLGSERGFSVKEAIETTKKITKKEFTVLEGPRRQGDTETSIASSEKAKKILTWQLKHNNLKTIIKTAWDWEINKKN